MLSYHREFIQSSNQVSYGVGSYFRRYPAERPSHVLGPRQKAKSGCQPQQEIKYSQDPDAAKHMTLLLKDFDPKPMLHTAVHETPRAKFPVIDVHNHVNDPGGVHGEEIAPAEVVRRMDRANVQKIVILTGMWGEESYRACWIKW